MRCVLACFILASLSLSLKAQNSAIPQETNNIYRIREQVLLHTPDREEDADLDKKAPEDNDWTKFERWYQFVHLRCYPSGELPSPDVLIKAYDQVKAVKRTANKTTGIHTWHPVGPMTVPDGYNGLGRINCIVVNPDDTSTIYIGSAGGGVFISHNGGHSWSAGTDDFPSLSIADIVLNPHNTDTVYAVTGDGYGYESNSYLGFWGGLYSAGIMMSADGGNTWQTTGLSYLQTNNDIVQKLLIHPANTNLLLAATRHGIVRSTDAGQNWTNVAPGHHFYSMAFHPLHPDTVYATNDTNLFISYNAGLSWQLQYAGINTNFTDNKNRATIAVSSFQPDNIWVLNTNGDLMVSTDMGNSFTTTFTSPNGTANFYGYYDNVLNISPFSSDIFACGMLKAKSVDGGNSWQQLDNDYEAHVDNHAITFNPLDPNVIYAGNDGGIFVTRDGGDHWEDLTNGLMISQIYRLSTSRQNPDLMLCGLQDNSTFRYDGSSWTVNIGGDGQACAISPFDDNIQIGSYQNGNYFISYDQGMNFLQIFPNPNNMNDAGNWTAPVAFDPVNPNNIYFGLYDGVYMSPDQGNTFINLNLANPAAFNPSGVTSLAIAPSNPQTIYASGDNRIFSTVDGGITWKNIGGNLPLSTVGISHIAVDYTDPKRVFVTTSGYVSGKKLFMSTTGGNSWTNISDNLPNLPATCVTLDSSTKGAVFVATDMGVYYRDSSMTSWQPYGQGLPNVIVDDMDINYKDYQLRVATYGRGVWKVELVKPLSVPGLSAATPLPARLFPNPASNSWHIEFTGNKPADYSVTVRDLTGRTIYAISNSSIIDASGLSAGIYLIEISSGDAHAYLKGIKQ